MKEGIKKIRRKYEKNEKKMKDFSGKERIKKKE